MKKATKKAVKKTAAKKAVKAVKKTVNTTAEKAVKKTVVKKTAAKKTPTKVAAKKAASSKTTIVADVDVGFGNTLYIRGDGPGLSWSKGVPMDCVGDTAWTLSLSGVTSAFEYKLLINDQIWSVGKNDVAKPGKSSSVVPQF